MPYLTVSDLISRFGAEEIAQLADRAIPRVITGALLAAFAGGEDLSAWTGDEIAAAKNAASIVTQAIADGQSEVDSYLSARYRTPLKPPTPPVILRFTGDVARYALYDDRATEEVRKRYEDAIKFLRAVAEGKASVVEEDGDEPALGGGTVEMVSAGNMFSRPNRGRG